MSGAPPSFHDLVRVVGKSSPLTSLDKLPRPLVGALPGYAPLVVSRVPWVPSDGLSSRLLTLVLYLCLAKKEPA